jgi:hypothetical protein
MTEIHATNNFPICIVDDEQHYRMDRISIVTSLICLLHCLLVPIVTLSFPFLTTLDSYTNKTHLAFAIVVVSLGMIALFKGYKHHKKLLPLCVGIIGMSLVVLALFIEAHEEHIHSYLTTHSYFTMTGSVLLVIAHFINMRSCRC